jgi:hypothetical protein
MKLPPTLRLPAVPTRRTETDDDYGARMSRDEGAEDTGYSKTFEPLLAGDRLREKRVPKAHNPLQRESFEVSLS